MGRSDSSLLQAKMISKLNAPGEVTISAASGASALVEIRPTLVFLPSYNGGIARYASEQSRELARRGEAVLVLATKALEFEEGENLRVRKHLLMVPRWTKSRILRRVFFIICILMNQLLLVANIVWHRPKLVLFDGYSEILAPIWVWPHLVFRRALGVRYAVTVHDPQRSRQLGPLWWHDLSVWAAYLPFSIAMVHGHDDAKRAGIPRHVESVVVPHGIFVTNAQPESSVLRSRLGIGVADRVALSVGYVADRKNLDIAIQAIASRPHVHLLVAGQQASSKDRPIRFYMDMAAKIGLANRVHFVDGYIPDDEIGAFFCAADVILLTYKSDFVSQSGILHLAANWDKPVLASSGPGPLLETIRQHNLGVVVKPDSSEELGGGLDRVFAADYPPLGWDIFRREASWKLNIDRLIETLDAQEARVQ
jgi:glycosyltransferase involved in cell wall biosynthesis